MRESAKEKEEATKLHKISKSFILYTYEPSFASSASSFPYRTQQQLLNIIGILPITTSFCKNKHVYNTEHSYLVSAKIICSSV